MSALSGLDQAEPVMYLSWTRRIPAQALPCRIPVMYLASTSDVPARSGSGCGFRSAGPACPRSATSRNPRASASLAALYGRRCAGVLGKPTSRDRPPSGIPVFLCAACLEQHAAGVEPESGHVRADLVVGGDGFGAGAGTGLAEQEGAGEQEAAGEPGGFFFLFGIAGDEGVAGELLDFPDVVVEQDVGEFVADVAVGAS